MESKVLKALIKIVELSIFPFSYVTFCYMYFRTLLLSMYTFMRVISIMKCPSLSLRIFYVLKPILYDINKPLHLSYDY